MALEKLNFTFGPEKEYSSISGDWSHTGVVGSGDMEILMTKKEQGGKVTVCVTTPVRGFDHIWKLVLEKYVAENSLGDVAIDINDNNSTPYIAAMRLNQALIEAKGEE